MPETIQFGKKKKDLKKRKKIKVEILGKGQEVVTIDDAQTVGDVRKLLALDKDVQAVNAQGDEMRDGDRVSGDISFMPNVEGG